MWGGACFGNGCLIGMREWADGERRDGDKAPQQNDADWPAPWWSEEVPRETQIHTQEITIQHPP